MDQVWVTTPDCVLKELFVLAGNQRMERMISVIVPVYQAQEYLEQCINSILGQDYENLEVLLIGLRMGAFGSARNMKDDQTGFG